MANQRRKKCWSVTSCGRNWANKTCGGWHVFCNRWNEAGSCWVCCVCDGKTALNTTMDFSVSVTQKCSTQFCSQGGVQFLDSLQCQTKAIGRRPLAMAAPQNYEALNCWVVIQNGNLRKSSWFVLFKWPVTCVSRLRLCFSMQRTLWHGWQRSQLFHAA